MPGYPYFGFPFFYRRNYSGFYNNYNFNNGYVARDSGDLRNNLHTPNSNYSSNSSTNNCKFVDDKENTSNGNNKNEKNPDNSCLFELFGLKLYFDDILIVCLLFFLYNEGVKDESLFVALILLLLS